MSTKSFLLTLTVLIPATIQAQAPAKAWLWAHSPTTAPYEPTPLYSYNSSGVANAILSHASTGEWVVDLPAIGAPTSFSGNYHVSAYGGAHFCNVYGFGPVATSMRAGVKCYDNAGTLVDARFTLLFHRQTANRPTPGAYLHANGETPIGVLTPVGPGSSWNSTGVVNFIVRQGTGRYQVNLAGMPPTGSQAMVTAIHNGPVRCQPISWNGGAGGTAVQVRCVSAAGVATNSDFFVSYLTDPRLDIGPASSFGAFFFANDPVAPEYTPAPTYAAYSNGRSATIRKRSGTTGIYDVALPGLPALDTSEAIVSAYGLAQNYCNPDEWVPNLANTALTVRCDNPAGNRTNAVFTVLYTGVARGSTPLVIDRFDTGSTRITLTTAGDRLETQSAAVPGGNRTVRQYGSTVGTGSISQADILNGLGMVCGCGTSCRTESLYGRSAVGAPSPLRLDLSQKTRFRLSIEGDATALTAAITVYSANGTRVSNFSKQIGAAGEVDFGFSDFLHGTVGPANWGDVTYIALIFQYSNGTSVKVRSFTAE